MVLTGGATEVVPRVVLRFEGLKNEFGAQAAEIEFFRPGKWIEIQPGGGPNSRVPDGSPPLKGRR